MFGTSINDVYTFPPKKVWKWKTIKKLASTCGHLTSPDNPSPNCHSFVTHLSTTSIPHLRTSFMDAPVLTTFYNTFTFSLTSQLYTLNLIGTLQNLFFQEYAWTTHKFRATVRPFLNESDACRWTQSTNPINVIL